MTLGQSNDHHHQVSQSVTQSGCGNTCRVDKRYTMNGQEGRVTLCTPASLRCWLLIKATTAAAEPAMNTCNTLHKERRGIGYSNDPTAGSPTVTLLRLLLPLNDQV